MFATTPTPEMVTVSESDGVADAAPPEQYQPAEQFPVGAVSPSLPQYIPAVHN